MTPPLPLTMKEEEMLCLLRLGPLTMREIHGVMGGSESMHRGILEHLKELKRIEVIYSRKPGTPAKYRGTAIYRAIITEGPTAKPLPRR